MRFSSRVDISEPNPIAKAEATAKTAGRPLGKLNDSNPTRHALAPDLVPDIYSADPRGQRYAREALAAFVAGILMGGDVERAPLNYADAYTMLHNWSRDDVEIPDGLTTRAFMDEWNRQIAADAQQH